MDRTHLLPAAALALALACLAPSAQSAESKDACAGFITSLPATISTQGNWCLAGDLATAISSGAAITIATNNVTIDCNHFKIGGLSAGPATSATGILATDRLNVSVRRCNLRGFMQGISIDGALGGGHLVEDNRVEASTYSGISVRGDGSTIRRNRVHDTGGTPNFGAAFGIFALGTSDVIDNTVDGVAATAGSNASGYGINTSDNFGGSVRGNRVRNVTADGMAASHGLYNGDNGRVQLSGNHVTGATTTYGASCDDAAGRARDNVFNGFVFAINGCGDAGGNDVYPLPPA